LDKKIIIYNIIMELTNIVNIDLFLIVFMIGIIISYLLTKSPEIVKKI